MACWPDHGKVCCLDCGSVYTVTFPTRRDMQTADDVLSARPEIETRNWFPDRETAADLKVENVTRGLRMRAA